MNGRLKRQQNEIVGDAALGAFGVAFDAFFFGFGANLLCLLLACVVGILWGLVRAKRGQQGLPWGPGIALAAWCAALFGQNLIDWYLSLL